MLLVALAVVVRGRMRAVARRAAFAAAASAGIALLIGQVLPSDHTTAAFAIATAILLRNRLWGPGAGVRGPYSTAALRGTDADAQARRRRQASHRGCRGPNLW